MGLKLKKRGNSTPSPTWKIGSFDFQTKGNKDSSFSNFNTTANERSCVSARKLGAFLWEAMPRHTLEKKMTDSAIDSPYEEEVTSSDSLSPCSLLGLEGKIGNSHFNLQASNDLVAVLNRIWTLEEQNASVISLVSSLKRELDQSNLQIKKLLLEKNKEQERVKATFIEPLKEELKVERKLRKQSKSLHKKLARELFNTTKEYEIEKKSKKILENLCDEFANGIRDYEREVKHNPDKELTNRKSPNKLILRLSKTWLDERKQMKLHDTNGDIVDKLSFEIEAFLQRKASLGEDDKLSLKKPIGRSLKKSFHLNDDIVVDGDDDSTIGYSKCVQNHLKKIPKLKTNKKVVRLSKKQGKVGDPRVNSNSILDNLIKSRILSIEKEKATSKWAYGLKESTLKAMLLEARLEGLH